MWADFCANFRSNIYQMNSFTVMTNAFAIFGHTPYQYPKNDSKCHVCSGKLSECRELISAQAILKLMSSDEIWRVERRPTMQCDDCHGRSFPSLPTRISWITADACLYLQFLFISSERLDCVSWRKFSDYHHCLVCRCSDKAPVDCIGQWDYLAHSRDTFVVIPISYTLIN